MKRYLKFWGTRGSCSVSGPEYVQFGGNTCCVEVCYDDTYFILDAGTGIRPLGETLKKKKEIHIFLGHLHWDHIIGFPFFEPLYEQGTEIVLWAPHGEGRSCPELIDQVLAPEFFPVNLRQIQGLLTFRTIHEKMPVPMGQITIDFHQTHHPGVTFCFKIQTPYETISYITDNEIELANQNSFIAFHKNSDYFIHEAQYFPKEYDSKLGWGHSSLSQTAEMVQRVKPGKWLVTHHDPHHTDADLRELAEVAKSLPLPCPVSWIPDGFVLPLK